MGRVFAKFKRPESPRVGRICSRDLDILEAVLRFRFITTSELAHLIADGERPNNSIYRRFRLLWEWNLLSRVTFSDPRHFQEEFVYYIEEPKVISLLQEHGRLEDVHPRMEAEIQTNREAGYGEVSRYDSSTSGRAIFLRHTLMISRMRFMLEMACRKTGRSDLSMFRPDLPVFRVTAPALKAVSKDGRITWQETSGVESLPCQPDALFTLNTPPGREVHFAYEADRGTMPPGDMLKKLRAYHYVKRQKKTEEAFGVHPIRAVLIEVPDEKRARKIAELICHPLVAGPSCRTGLFWLISSDLFKDDKNPSPYLTSPEMVLQSLWALPEFDVKSREMEFSMHGLLDEEN